MDVAKDPIDALVQNVVTPPLASSLSSGARLAGASSAAPATAPAPASAPAPAPASATGQDGMKPSLFGTGGTIFPSYTVSPAAATAATVPASVRPTRAAAGTYTGGGGSSLKAGAASRDGGMPAGGAPAPAAAVGAGSGKASTADLQDRATSLHMHQLKQMGSRYAARMRRALPVCAVTFLVVTSLLLLFRPVFVYAEVDEFVTPQVSLTRVFLIAAASSMAVFAYDLYKMGL